MIKLALVIALLVKPEPDCVKRPLEQGRGSVLVCKAGVL